MKLARVVATVTSTINVPIFDGRKLLVCDLLDPDLADAGGYLIAVDTVGAGPGETVLLMDEGNSARQILDAKDAPIRTLVVGIVDDVELERSVAGGPAAGPEPAGPTNPTRSPRQARPRPSRPRKAR